MNTLHEEEKKYPTRLMVQACIRKFCTLREMYSEETLIEMITDEMHEGCHKFINEAVQAERERIKTEIFKQINSAGGIGGLNHLRLIITNAINSQENK